MESIQSTYCCFNCFNSKLNFYAHYQVTKISEHVRYIQNNIHYYLVVSLNANNFSLYEEKAHYSKLIIKDCLPENYSIVSLTNKLQKLIPFL